MSVETAAVSDVLESRPPRLLVCGFGPFPAAPENPAAVIVDRLRDAGWSPPNATVAYTLVPTLWDTAAETVLAAANAQVSGVLLVGVATRASGFRVETRAQNRTSAVRADAGGAILGRDRIDPTGPATARVTAPVGQMLSALRDAGLPAERSSDAGGYLCNYTLYRVLTRCAEARAAGFLHVPQAAEFGGSLPLNAIDRGVRAAATAFAQTLSASALPA